MQGQPSLWKRLSPIIITLIVEILIFFIISYFILMVRSNFEGFRKLW
jgi:hypothetical protein